MKRQRNLNSTIEYLSLLKRKKQSLVYLLCQRDYSLSRFDDHTLSLSFTFFQMYFSAQNLFRFFLFLVKDNISVTSQLVAQFDHPTIFNTLQNRTKPLPQTCPIIGFQKFLSFSFGRRQTYQKASQPHKSSDKQCGSHPKRKEVTDKHSQSKQKVQAFPLLMILAIKTSLDRLIDTVPKEIYFPLRSLKEQPIHIINNKSSRYKPNGQPRQSTPILFKTELVKIKIQLVQMSVHDYFQAYIEIIAETLRKVRKIGFKKLPLIKDLIDTAETFLEKQVYGRIEPANYLLVLVVLLGSKIPKLYSPVISAVQRMFSYNFISPNEDLWGSLKLLKEEHKQFLLLPAEDYGSKSFKEIYIETLMNLGDKDEGLNLSIAKSVSLIWRLDQNSIPLQLLVKIFDYLLDCMTSIKLEEEEKMIKSVFLEMFRHALESYRQAQDKKFLNEDNCVSLKSVVHKYGRTLADQVAIQLDVASRLGIKQYAIIPNENQLQAFQLQISEQSNENGSAAGKFGWCTNCRQPANYYCSANRLPVCSYQCKLIIFNEIQSLQKFLGEEERSMEVFEEHIISMLGLFSRYLSHSDIKKRVSFSEIFVLMTSELKKIVDKLSPKTYTELRGVVRQVLVNIYAESEAFLPCMATIKKFLHLRIFIDQTEILLRLFAKKLTHYLTTPNIREEILKFFKDLVGSRFIFDAVLTLDCSANHYDAVREVVDAFRQLYIGIQIPEAVTMPPQQDGNARRTALQICLMILRFLSDTDKKMAYSQAQKLVIQKNKLNMIRNNIIRFNESEKPLKITKKLVDENFLPRDPEKLAAFLHQNLKNLNLTNVGQLIGDIDEYAGQIRKHYIGQMNFRGLLLDQAMRVMLKNFTLPGESQVVERIIETFGITYFQQNKEDTVYNNSDAVYAFSYLLMMLQSNLHNPQVVQKMTLPQFSKLSKGMNGPDIQFDPDFLQKIYMSVQRKPLGVHQKLKQIQIIIAYNTNPKKAQQIYLKDLQRQAVQSLQILQDSPLQELQHSNLYPIPIFVEEFVSQIIDMLCFKIKDLQEKDKEEILKCLESVESAMKLGSEWLVPKVIERAIQKIWEEIQRSGVYKKYMLMEAMLDWVRKYSEHINIQWKTVIYLISRFNRSKSIRKDQNTGRRHSAITLLENRCYLYDSYIDHLMNRTHKFHSANLISFLRALLSASKDETNDTGSSFCLQKINEVIQHNGNRSLEILNIFWNELRDYYIQLGKHKNERVALFSSDFLKQIVTKFLKRKDLLVLQKEYLKPFEQIFVSSKSFAVKELMIGSLNYFVSNHHTSLKTGWRVILSVVSSCFEQEEEAVIKQKAYGILKKLFENNFQIFNLQQNYNDIIQILNKLTREKEETYGLGCLHIIQLIIQYYHIRLGIDLDKSIDAEQNKEADINFWQTVFLPLLNIIFPMCGDCRTNIQSPAIKALFEILIKYGKLFRYEFWKMVLQGVLRPAFEEITYTSQSKPLKKQQLEQWLNYSFTVLFKSINELIVLYYSDFRLFLEDVFKIYENCILNHSLILLIDLSLKALTQLMDNIAPNFESHDWEVYLFFVQSLFKKTLPIELSSIESWNRSKDLLENNHQAKCFALQTFLHKMQIVFQKYPKAITVEIYQNVLKELQPIYQFVVDFNQNLQLRDTLWKNGFYQEQKILPGLVRHQYEILAFRSKIYFKLVQFDPAQIKQYFKHLFSIIDALKGSMLHQILKEPQLKDYERERSGMYYRKLLNQILLGQVMTLGSQTLQQAGMSQRLLQQCLNLMGNRLYCTRCSFCEGCQNSAESWQSINRQLQGIVMMLFKRK